MLQLVVGNGRHAIKLASTGCVAPSTMYSVILMAEVTTVQCVHVCTCGINIINIMAMTIIIVIMKVVTLHSQFFNDYCGGNLKFKFKLYSVKRPCMWTRLVL